MHARPERERRPNARSTGERRRDPADMRPVQRAVSTHPGAGVPNRPMGETVAAYARSHAAGLARTAPPPNRTGLPDWLKAGVETLSGLSLDDVRVHRGSSRPAALHAHAYTKGSEIHLAPGQERHLAHETWHVVQQKQGRVRPTLSLGGTAINNDVGLEHEADRMGARIEQARSSGDGPGGPVQHTVAASPVVQRSVLHLQAEDGSFIYYSDLEVVRKGKRLKTFTERAEAQEFDDKLAADAPTLAKAIVTSQKRARRVPTPYGHLNTHPGAKVRHQDQGPHSLSFISLEQRLQNRLRKGQQAELLDQMLTPERAEALFKAEYGVDDDDARLKRYALDYRSLYGEFLRRQGDDDRGIGSAYHLVVRKLLQLHPYTTYNGPKSTNRGEDRNAFLGSNTLDTGARFKNAVEYETYLQTRGDAYHSSDEEEEEYEPRKGASRWAPRNIPARDRKYSRKRKRSLSGGESDAAKTLDDASSSTSAEKERPRKLTKTSEHGTLFSASKDESEDAEADTLE